MRLAAVLLALAACRGAAVAPKASPATPADASAELGALAREPVTMVLLADRDGDGRREPLIERDGQLAWLRLPAFTPEPLALPRGRLLAACDLDGDRRADPVLKVADGLLVALAAGPVMAPASRPSAAACVDPERDGRDAVVVGDRALHLWALGPGGLVDQARERGLVAAENWGDEVEARAFVVAPFASEASDVFVVVDNADNLFFQAQPQGGWVELARSLGVEDRRGRRRAGGAALDVDGDGRLDLVVAAAGGRHHLYAARGGGFADVPAPPLAEESAGGPVVVANLDGLDGPELYLPPGRLFSVSEGITVPIEAGSLAPLTDISAAVAGDLDGDRRDELLVVAGRRLSLHRVRR